VSLVFKILMNTEIIKDYINGLSNKELSIKYNLHRGTIQRILKRNNICLRKQENTSRKYCLIEDFFNKIDNENKAYILGLLYADGNVYKNYISISLIDKDVLEKIVDIIAFGKRGIIKERESSSYFQSSKKGKKQYRFTFSSKKMCKDLLLCGCSPDKTFLIKLPLLDEHLMRHFVRGYFDGDGCLCITKNKNNSCITIVSNKTFIEELSLYVNKILGINSKNKNKKNDINYLGITGRNQVKKFLNWIYQDANIFIQRKYNKYNEFLNI